jgi:transposase
MSKVGSSRLRKALFMPALVALQHNEVFIAFKARLLAAGKPKMLIVGAAMRKLVHVIYGVLKSGRPFDAKTAMGA